LNYLLLLVGFVLLIKGADLFVESSVGIAKFLKIPSLVVGMTIVAMGTSAPEAAVSITAALGGANDIAVGNVLGSNIFNLLVVVGICAIIKPMDVEPSVLRREFPFSILITGILLLLCLNLTGSAQGLYLSRLDGVILMLLFAAFLVYSILAALRFKDQFPQEDETAPPLLKSILLAVVGIVGIVAGGQMVVNSASGIAADFGVSQNLIGLTIVAIGTSLPELVTSLVAARKGENNIAMGNVIGSNIFNILFVLAASAAIHPITVNILSIYDTIVLIVVSLISYGFALKSKNVNRPEGLAMVLLYIAYSVYIVLR